MFAKVNISTKVALFRGGLEKGQYNREAQETKKDFIKYAFDLLRFV